MPIINLVYEAPTGWRPGVNTLLYLPLNGNANDESGNGNNGTASNITWDSGGDGGCASFNGSNSYIDVPSLSISDNLTVSCWIKTTQVSVGEIIQMYGTQKSLEFRVVSGKLNLQLRNDGIGHFDGGSSTNNINTGQWINVTLTKEGTTYKIYINNNLEGTFVSTFLMLYDSSRIGLHGSGNSDAYNGLIDNFIIEDKARSADERTDYYNLTKSSYGL